MFLQKEYKHYNLSLSFEFLGKSNNNYIDDKEIEEVIDEIFENNENSNLINIIKFNNIIKSEIDIINNLININKIEKFDDTKSINFVKKINHNKNI